MTDSRNENLPAQDAQSLQPIRQLLSDIETTSHQAAKTHAPSEANSVKKGILHIEVEKYLNHIYPLNNIQQQAFNIVLTSKASDGFGDVIWGLRAIQALQVSFPHAHFSIISDALDKFNLFIPSSSNITLIYADPHAAFNTAEASDFPDKNKGKLALETCDLAIDGPYLWSIEQLSTIYDVNIDNLVKEKRYLRGLEYDCARYWPNWKEQITTDQFLSGLGDNAYGIFIIDELKVLNHHNMPLSSVERVRYTQDLESIKLKKTLTRVNPEGDCPIYFGYGEHLPAKFLEVVSRVEDNNTSTQDVIILLKSRDPDALDKLMRVLEAKPLANISSIVSIKDEYPISDEALEARDIKMKKTMPAFYNPSLLKSAKEAQHALREKIPAGETCFTNTEELIHFSSVGKKIKIIIPEGLTQTDMMAIYKFTQPLTMVTGDQSLSEYSGPHG